MSIPKEPRQLMINIMYLVLTALLALNVSAEIFNAFDMVDDGLNSANTALDKSNAGLPQLIRDGAKKKESLTTYAERIDPVRSLSEEATSYIDGIINEIKENSSGRKDYAGVTRIMVDEGKGEELKSKLLEFKQKFASYADEEDREELLTTLPIEIDDESWQESVHNKKNWADFTFGHMPQAAVLPIFSKFKNDIKSSENKMLSYLANKVGTNTDVVLDKFTVVSAPEKSYVIKGEQFKTEVFLSASAGSDSNTGISISVNGSPLQANADGVATFTQTPGTVGVKRYNAAITVTNPTTGEKETFTKEFQYEVGERSVAISASKMNVFYIGVDNPVEVSAAGVPSNQINVSMTGGGGQINRNSDGTYTVRVSQPTNDAKINVSAPGMNASKSFRVKRIPDPIAKLSQSRGGVMSSGEFKAQQGVIPALENFDFDARCQINGFRLVRVAPRQDAEIAVNSSGRYSGQASALVNKAAPGDRFFFEDIKATCPGDRAARDIGSMTFNIR